jgi:transposase
MRGQTKDQQPMFVLDGVESRIPKGHVLRSVKELVDEALGRIRGDLDRMYSSTGRPSIPPERLLKAQILIALYSIRSDRMFCEQLEYNLLFRWFLDMQLDEEAFDASTFSKNRQRLIDHEVGQKFLASVVKGGQMRRLMSSEHFSVDGTLIEAWASLKSFRPRDEDGPKDGNGWSDFSGTKRSNETHESKTDPESRLMRKGNGQAAKLSFNVSALMENRNGLLMRIDAGIADGYAERSTALEQIRELRSRSTVAADRAYDAGAFVEQTREAGCVPHVAPVTYRRSAIDRRTTRHAGYAVSQVKRRLIEKSFGWMKTIGGLRRTRFRGVQRTNLLANICAAAFNLIRIARLEPVPV